MPTIEVKPYQDFLPIKWPMPALTADQIAAVKACDLKIIPGQRYPVPQASDTLLSRFVPDTDCDWAILAVAYANRIEQGDAVPESAKSVLAQVVLRNPAFVLSPEIFYTAYADSVTLVEAPPLLQQAIVKLDIRYEWSGMGDQVGYHLKVSRGDTTPAAVISQAVGFDAGKVKSTVNPAFVQALSPALTNLVPINTPFTLLACSDNYPDWTVTVTYVDGFQLTLKTNGSNILYAGAPWQTQIDQQTYLQWSSSFTQAIVELVKALGIPLGQPMAMTCYPETVIDKAFP